MKIIKRTVFSSIKNHYLTELSKVNITEEEIIYKMERTIGIVDTIDIILKDL